jgi:hypothetical protein
MYEITSASYTPENFIAGDFPMKTDTGTVKSGATVRKYAPVVQGADGIAEAAADTLTDLVGIAADEPNGGEVVYYLTGEFFIEALVLPDGVTAETLKPACRKLGIILREGN